MRSVEQRLVRLENRPQGQIPRFIIECADGHKEHFIGADIISHCEGIRRIFYDPQHQPSVDIAALYQMLHGDKIEVLPTF